MSPRTGRPKSENPKREIIGVRLDRETVEKLDETAKLKDTTRSEIVRQGIDRIHSEAKENP